MSRVERIVTSLEVSKKLKDLGILQESCFYWVLGRYLCFIDDEVDGDRYYCNVLDDEYYAKVNEIEDTHIVSAFTVTELGALNDSEEVCRDPDGFGEWLVRRCSFGLQYDNEKSFTPKSSHEIIQNRIERLNQNLLEWREG
jgi:hypothetical protein